MQCAIFSAARFRTLFPNQRGVVNGPRRPSEATTSGLAPKYRKIEALGLSRFFSAIKRAFYARKNQNIGLLCIKVTYFCLESSDVFASPTPIFPAFCPIWGSFSGRLACDMPKFLFSKPNYLIYTYGKTSKFATFSALEAMPDTVKIFEGFRRFLTLRFRRIPDIETGQCAIISRMFQPHFPSPAGHDIHHPPATWTEAQPCSTIRAALCRGFQGKMS